MSKEVGAGGRFEIFLDSDLEISQPIRNPELENLTNKVKVEVF